MHGRLKVRTTEEVRIQKEKERAKKLASYKSIMTMIMDKRSKQQYDKEALDLTVAVLSSNPDISSLWNYRREIILSIAESETTENMSKLYDEELQLTEVCLKSNHKSYPCWYQRIWVLGVRSDPDWNKELKLCNMYLKLDERNFHCWDYRRHVVNQLGSEDENEFKFTTDKLEENFSNYSAWHYRSKMLTKLYPDPEGVRAIQEKKHRDELELVLNAAFTDPNDTSAWFYQRWLLGEMQQQENLAVIRITSDKSFVAFNQAVSCPSSKIKIEINNEVMDGEWKSLTSYERDVIWVLNHSKDVSLDVNTMGKVTLETENQNISVSCILHDDSNSLVGYGKAEFLNVFGAAVLEELQKQVDCCEQLLELEPDSKWTLLTLTVIKHSIASIENHENCIEMLNKLIELDSKRTNYYNDLASRWQIEHTLQTSESVCKSGNVNPCPLIKLSTLYHLQYWSANSVVYLNDQQLLEQCLPKLYVLQNCEILHLENNKLESLKGFPSLPNLKTIYLQGNKLTEDDKQHLSKCPQLKDVIFDAK